MINHSQSLAYFLLHAADVLLGIGVVIFFCVAFLLLLSGVAARGGKTRRRRPMHMGGLNRAARRKERAMSRRKR